MHTFLKMGSIALFIMDMVNTLRLIQDVDEGGALDNAIKTKWGIRTPEPANGLPEYQSGAIDHSANYPLN